ncbi:MAG: GntR family transcriptional regulator [Paludibacteraceae bacterium]|nr:GntR family transcriptional regulator [Paludibacteraceae bacterium]MBN2788075.1 GntR family transcriptional regulator [Paludibacteraceae bacterium]
MVQIGKYNDLHLTRFCDMGAMFDGGEAGEILMPKRYLKDWMEVGSLVHVLVYPDSEDKLVCTREKAYAQVGDFVFLQVELVNEVGAYLDWGVARKLFVPIREQRARMQEEGVYLVHICYNENTHRIYGTAKYDQYIDKSKPPYQMGDEVQILIAAKTDLGFKAIINNQYVGMLYANELFDTLELGHTCTAYIKRVRDDFKIDLSLSKIGYAHVADFSEELHQRLIERGGFIAVTDKTEAETIYELFGVSKKTFKKALGDLYRKQLIRIDQEGIQLLTDNTASN